MNLLHLATADDTEKLLPLIERYHAFEKFPVSEEQRREALEQMFSGEVQAAIWLIGPRKSPVGYIAVVFGFSIRLGGRDAFVDEFYIRDSVRGRGMGTQAMAALISALRNLGVKTLRLEIQGANANARRFCERAGFRSRDGYCLMSRTL